MDIVAAQASYDVYTGVWIKSQAGNIYGATLTLSRSNGAILVAFLALYVALAGQGCWNIARFLWHRALSSTSTPDGIYNQRQAILRNSDSAYTAALQFLEILWAWRKKRVWGLYKRLLPVLGFSLLLSLGFAAAGILSSRVVTNDVSEVLLSGRNCGAAANISRSDQGRMKTLTRNRSIKFAEYASYAKECYRIGAASESAKCQTYVTPNLPYTKRTNITCPFDKEICALESGNVEFDTGYLASDAHLGINGNPKFLLRQTRQCAPLAITGRTEFDETGPFMNYYYYYRQNSTEAPPAAFSAWMKPVEQGTPYTYQVVAITHDPAKKRDIILLPARSQPDAYITVLFLTARDILYSAPVSDPWFAANEEVKYMGGYYKDILVEGYKADNPASAVACATKVYICNPLFPTSKRCVNAYLYDPQYNGTSLLGLLSTLWPKMDDSLSVYGSFTSIQTKLGVFEPLDSQYTELLAEMTLQNRRQLDALPNDQWQHEMEYSFQVGLASIQGTMVEAALGAQALSFVDDFSNEKFCQPRNACWSICTRSMINSPLYQSFSVLGLSIIICLGGLLTLVGLFIEPIATWIMRKGSKRLSRKNIYARLEWHATSTLQLQRLAHERFGRWKGANDAVPMTEYGAKLGVLDIKDEKHPVLMHWSMAALVGLGDVSTKSSQERLAGSTTNVNYTTDDKSLFTEVSEHEVFLSQRNYDYSSLNSVASPVVSEFSKKRGKGLMD
ncbi:hypothetical protein GQ44DRAFT_700586 [Phaeosphaeriaceae sp. PMI808]|nr:hypothetical protein GQ44DRAFT_700586 [Phaeosphaeriaceae sp. PMI808]